MEYCYKCKTPETKAILFDVVLPSGIEKVCNKCSAIETHPVIKKQFLIPEKGEVGHVRERLKQISGIKDFHPGFEMKKETKQESTLREIVEKNYKQNLQRKDDSDFVANFHWIVMRARRSAHLSQKQLAEAINEPEIAITMLEKGIPGNSELIRKLENYLRIRIKKPKFEEPKPKPRELDINAMKEMTLSDIKNLDNDFPDDFDEIEQLKAVEDMEEFEYKS